MLRIVTDAASNLPRQIVQDLDITVAPGYVSFDNEVVSATSISAEEFFRRLAQSKKLPVSRDSGVKDFTDIYRRLLIETPGASILSIHLSESLATTINSARQAAALLPNASIRLFNTQNVALGEGLMVWEAARMAKDGASIDDILKRLLVMRERVEHLFMVDTLVYLEKGGRVGPVARLAGDLLNLKPILTVKDGLVQSHSRFVTRGRALSELKQYVLAKCEGSKGLRIGIMHAVCPDDARELADEFRKKLNPETLAVTELGPILGTNTGPGALAVAWYAPPATP